MLHHDMALRAMNGTSNWENQCPLPATLLPVEIARTIWQLSVNATFTNALWKTIFTIQIEAPV
jgi:hypothetical protein